MAKRNKEKGWPGQRAMGKKYLQANDPPPSTKERIERLLAIIVSRDATEEQIQAASEKIVKLTEPHP